MILGLGTDLAGIEFWQEAIADPTTSVLDGTFTAQELEYANAGPTPAAHRLAARFAAKEACVKAFGSTRFGCPPLTTQINLREIEVVNDKWGRPSLVFHNNVQTLAQKLGVTRTLLSLSHDEAFASATVILEG